MKIVKKTDRESFRETANQDKNLEVRPENLEIKKGDILILKEIVDNKETLREKLK